MLVRGLLMLGLVSASLAFSLHSQPTCCSPVEFETLLSASSALGSVKSSQSSSGRLAVDHQHRLAALYLMYPAMDMNLINFTGNATPFSHIADAARTYIHAIQRFVGEYPELVLYIVHEQQQEAQQQVSPVCKAFILPAIITELGQRCFSSPSQSFLDMIAPNNPATFAFRGTDPTELFAYEMYMSRQGCTPTQASISSVVSSLEMNFLASAVNPSISDRSIFNVPAPCAGVTPSRISYPSRGNSGPSSYVQQLVKLYALSQLRPHIQPRQQRSVGDAQQPPAIVQDVESILAFEEMLTLVSTVLGDLQDELGGNRGPSFGGRNSPDIQDLIPILVKANILPQILGSVGGSSSNQPSIQDIINAVLKSNLISVGSNSPSVQSLIQTLIKKSLLPSDSSSTDTLVTLLIAENIISSRQEYDALQQLLAEAVALHVLVPHIIHVEMLYQHQQQQQGPNYQQLMALMALLQGQQQQPSYHLPELIKHENDQSGPDYSQLLQMLLLQQYQASQSQSGGHLPAYLKHQNDNSGPDLSDLLKLLKISP